MTDPNMTVQAPATKGDRTMKIGWVGIGRMGLPMVNRLLDADYSLTVWNRTRAKAAPLAARGVTIVDAIADLRDSDAVFTMLATGKDLVSVCFGENGLAAKEAPKRPGIIVDCSTIGLEESRDIRVKLGEAGVDYLAAPVSGNPKCVIAGKLSSVVSGSAEAFDAVKPIIEAYAPSGVAYVGEGELARICKVAHNVLLGTTIANLVEVTLMAQKAGVPRHAFLKFINSSVMGSVFTRYKSPALVNLDWATTLTPALMLKDLDLGLESARKLAVPAPITAAVREVFQAHIGASGVTPGAERFEQADFAALFETAARGAGVIPESENVQVPSGLESGERGQA
jgi:3-hydroxyisobutyrate dehydrogenase